MGVSAFQSVQIGAALLILLAFAAQQAGWLAARSRLYLALNLVGSAALAIQAFVTQQWGFFLLEAVWAIISAAGLLRGSAPAPQK